MKPLHTSSQVTASDSRMVVRVGELSTPDGPVRRIVVTADAEMDTTEARWLRDKLDLAITLAEQPEPREWRKGDPEPDDFPTVASPSGGNEFAHREGGWFHTGGCTCCVDIPWDELVRQLGVLTEVLPDPEAVTA